MSAQTSPAGLIAPPERTPAAIRAELPEVPLGQFDAEYHAALEEARASYQLDRLNEVIRSYPPEFGTQPFGDWGLIVYLIRERQATVVLLDLIWAGSDPRRDRGS
jgi:uncharacterized protein DUF6247